MSLFQAVRQEEPETIAARAAIVRLLETVAAGPVATEARDGLRVSDVFYPLAQRDGSPRNTALYWALHALDEAALGR